MKKKFTGLKILAVSCVILGFAALGITIYLLCNDGKVSLLTPLNLDEASKVGDFVGGFVGIFWSIAGILLLFITLRLQSDEFRETQRAITKQQFETTFFNMLTVLGNIRSQIKYIPNNTALKAKESNEFIAFALEELKGRFENELINNQNLKNEITLIEAKVNKIEVVNQLELATLKNAINDIYLKFYSDFHSELGHYFRYVYNLMKFTINSRKSEKDEKIYLDLIQAQLSNDEMALIFYNSLSDKGVNQSKIPQFYNWIEKYSFLENMDVKSLIRKAHHVLFPLTIFKFLSLDERKEKENRT